MICANCGHQMGDHIDRAFGGWFCAPAVGTGSHATKRCDCAGWRTETAEDTARRLCDWAGFVRAGILAGTPWLRLPAVWDEEAA